MKDNIDNPRVFGQTIGRRFGKFWEDCVKLLFQYAFPRQSYSRVMFTDFVKVYTNNFIVKNKVKSECKDALERLSYEFFKKSGTEKQDLCDIVIANSKGQKLALETKWRVLWNDAKTVRQTVLSGEQLLLLGYKPIILLKRPRSESRESVLSRCEKQGGWSIVDSNEALDFIKKNTGFDLETWISREVDFWSLLKPFHRQFKRYHYLSKDFKF